MDDKSHLPIHGTLGYIDLDYFLTGRISYESDVYGIDVLLAQLLAGKMDIFDDGIEYVSLAECFMQLMDKGLASSCS